MAKYAGNQEYLTPPRSFAEKLNIASEGVSKGLQFYAQYKTKDEANKVLNNPNATPIQKAIALANMGHEKLGSDVLKTSVNQSIVDGINQKLQEDLKRIRGGNQNAPNANNVPVPTTNQAPTTAQPGPEGSPTQRPFTVNGPQNAGRNATELGFNAPATTQNAPQVAPAPQMSPRDQALAEADAYDQAASAAAQTGNVALQRDYQEKANQRRKDVRVDQQAKAKEKVAIRNANKAFREKIVGGIKNSKKMDFQLDQMEQLNEEGIEVSPLGYTALNMAGVPLSAFFDAPNAEALNKLSMDTTTGAVRDYGNRLFASEFKVFLQRIPELWQSQEGRRRVIKTMRMYNNLEKTEQDAYLQLYDFQKSQGEKNPVVEQEDVVRLAEERENQLIDQLNTELASERQIRDLGEVGKNKTLVRFPDGQILPVPNNELKEALQWGEVITR